MLRSSIKMLLHQALSDELIEKGLYDLLLQTLEDPNHHKTLRSEIMMVVFPLRMNHAPADRIVIRPDGTEQIMSSDLVSIDLVVERVSFLFIKSRTLNDNLGLVNQPVSDSS